MAEFQIYSSSNSLQKGIGRDLSPHRYDADFYRRKSDRLQEQLLNLTDQLNKARLRLRKAQDFEIKCQLIYKQNLQTQEIVARKEKEAFQLRAENQQMRLRLEQKGVKNDQNIYEKQRILRQIQVWKLKCLQAEQRCKLIATEEQSKNDQRIRREMATNKRNFDQKQKEFRYEIERLKKQLKEKLITDHSSHQKIDKIKKEKEQQIKRLEQLVAQNREEYMAMMTEKNQQILNQKNHFQFLMNQALGKLKNNLNHQDDKFKVQLTGLSNVIKIKNQQISKLQNEMKSLVQNYNKQRQQLNKEIRMLKNKIYQLQLAHDQEIVNLKQRLTTLHAVDINSTQEYYQKLLDAIKEERSQLEELLNLKLRQNEKERNQSDKEKAQLNQTIADKNRTIDQLSSKFSSSQTTNGIEVSNLQQALATISNQKQQLTNEYQSNVTFLNQQINKLTLSNQLKNNEIKELHQYNALLKRQQFQQIRQLEQKWKQQRKDRETERQKQRDLRQKVEQDFRQQQKAWKNRQRQLQKQFQKEKRQKNKLTVSLQSTQKQVQRLFKQNIMLQQRCKKQEGKNQRTILTGGGAKRELQNELIRQKAQLQALKRLQIDQFKKESELELTRLRNTNQRIQNELTSKKIDYENLQTQFKKISSQYRNIEKINKQKLVDYQKKISTLNSQILLTQNLYQNLIAAKSKVIKEENN